MTKKNKHKEKEKETHTYIYIRFRLHINGAEYLKNNGIRVKAQFRRKGSKTISKQQANIEATSKYRLNNWFSHVSSIFINNIFFIF